MRVQGYRSGAVRTFLLHLLVFSAFIGIFLSPFHAEGADTATLIVKLPDTLSMEEQAQVIATDGGVQTSSIPALRLHIVTVPAVDLPLILQNYQNDPQVVSVEVGKSRRAEAVPTDFYYDLQWALGKIGWDRLFGSVPPAGSARIALLDTGINAGHIDLSGSVVPGTSILMSSEDGQTDPNGHGTALAGIIAAVANNGDGIAGVAYPGVTVMPVTVLDASGVGQDSDIIAGIVWAVDNGADVILMAFSNEEFSQSLQDAIDYAWSKGAVLVAATGSGGPSAPAYPAGCRGVIGVSATDEADMLAAGSNYGPSTFLAAPGTNIFTTSSDGGYSFISGTSASSAFVAAVAGFIKASDPALTNGVIVGRIARTADAAGAADDPENQAKFGNGRVNMARAVADTSTDALQPAGAAPLANGGPFVGPYLAAGQIDTLSIETQVGELTYGRGGSATFKVTGSAVENGKISSLLSIDGLPGSITASFLPKDLSGFGSAASELTLTTASSTAAGTYRFTVTATANPEVVTAIGTITIAPRSIVVTAIDQVKTYGEELTFGSQHFTAGAMVVPDKIDSVVFTCAGASPTAPPGVYLIEPSNATGSFNPINYNITYQAGKLAVAKKPTTVTLTDLAQVYTGKALTPRATTDSSGLSITWTNAPQTNAGTYEVTATVDDPNYAGSASGTFRIYPASQEVTFYRPEDQQYGALPFILNAGATSALPVGFRSLTASVCTVSGNRVSIAGLGTCTIEATQPGNGNFYAALPVQQSFTVTAGALDHFAVTVDALPKKAGESFTVTVAALDAANNIIEGYSGPANLTTTAGTILPPVTGVFQNGTWSEKVTVTGAGPDKSITVTDTATGKVGNSGNFEVSPGQAAAFSVEAPPSAIAGEALTVTVTAKDRYDNVASGYLGTITFATVVPGATLPASFTFRESDGGRHTFTDAVTIFAAGIEKVTATDPISGFFGFSNSIEVSPAGATELLVKGPSNITAGSSFDLTVTARDAFGNTNTDYLGTVHFTSNDPHTSALVPADYTFLPEDNGTHTFSGVTLTTSGTRTVSAVDTSSLSIAGTSGSIDVLAGTAASISVETAADGSGIAVGALSITAGNSVMGYAVARDRYRNFAENVAAMWSLESTTDGVAVNDLIPAPDAKSATFTGKGAGTATIVAASAGLQGRSGVVTVTPAALHHFALSTIRSPLTLGTSVPLSITAQDPFGNIVKEFNEAVDLAISIGSTVSPSPTTSFSNGLWRGLVTVTGAGTQRTITATRSAGNESGMSNTFDVVKASQAIVMGTLSAKTYGDAPFGVTAQGGGSGNAVTFTAAPQAVCTISGAIVTIDGAGTCVVTASQAGNDTYEAAVNVVRSFTVNKATPIITFDGISSKTTSDPPFTVSATSSSGQPVSYQLLSGPATLSGNMVTITGAGSIALRAYQAANANYNAAFVDQSVAVTVALTKCATPGVPTLPATTYGSVSLQWTASSTPNVTYVVEKQPVGGSWSYAGYTGTSNYATIVIPVGGSYTFRVKATRSDLQDSAYSASSTVCTVTLAPPSVLQVPANSTGLIPISWRASATAGAGYMVAQSSDGTNWVETYIGTNTNTTVTVTTQRKYWFKVKAVKDGFADSAYTPAVACNVYLGAPTTLLVPVNSTGVIPISWKPSTTAGAGYVVVQSSDGTNWVQAYSGTNTSTTVTMTKEGKYWFKVKAVKDGFTDSAYTPTAACDVYLGAPSTLLVPANSTGSIPISWKPSATAGARYVLEQSSDGTTYVEAYRGTDTYTTVTVTAQGKYWFKVKAARDDFTDSAYTPAAACNVALGAPSTLLVPASSTGSISISWKPSTTAGAQYLLEKSSDGSTWGEAYSGTSTNATVVIGTSGNYSFRVSATHANFDQSGYATSTTVCKVTVP